MSTANDRQPLNRASPPCPQSCHQPHPPMPTATPMSTVMPLTHAGSCTSILTPSHPHTWACTGHACKYICGTRGCVQPLPCGQLQRMTALIPCLSYPALPCLAPHASVMVDTIRVPPGPHVSCYVTHSHTARSRQWVLCVKDQLRSHHVDVWTEVRCSPPLPSPPLPSPPLPAMTLLPPLPCPEPRPTLTPPWTLFGPYLAPT